MTAEQKLVVDNFKKNFKNLSRIIVYGTGINAEAVIKLCPECDIIGVMDSAKVGQTFFGLPVMSDDEVIKSGSKYIVIIARPAVHQIIYRRVKKLVVDNGITVFDIYGHVIESKNSDLDDPYFEKKYDDLIAEIDRHDVISFDVFDTLVSRCVSNPLDVFELMDINIRSQNVFSLIDVDNEKKQELIRFSRIRIGTEREIRHLNPDIKDIYCAIEKEYNFDEALTQRLLECELETEMSVLRPRSQMVKCLKYALEKEKKVILTSDMYFGEERMKTILDRLGIVGYHKIYVSCDYKVTKENGLFSVVKNDYADSNILHIGDNENGDYNKPKEIGIDAYLIMSAMRMLELSTHRNILSYANNLYTKIITGMVATKLFDNPFVLYNSKGKVSVNDEEVFTYVYIAPAIVSFVIWFIKCVEGKEGIILFGSRDGYIIQKLYRMIALKYNIKDLPEDEYFFISRKAVLQALKEKNTHGINYLNYIKYIEGLNLDDYIHIYMFDFMSKGTCQYALESILEKKIKGVYFQKSIGTDNVQNQLDATAFYKETSALEANRYIFAMCDFFECVLSSSEPSLEALDSAGKPIYFKEIRSKEQISLMLRMHECILRFADEFLDILNISNKVSEDLCGCKDMDGSGVDCIDYVDELLRCTDVENAIIDIKSFQELILDISEEEVKNTGYDLFVGGRKSDT